MRHDFDTTESPDEKASRRFFDSLEEERSGAMVLSDMSGHNFWWQCNLCLGDERRKAPRRYQDKAQAQLAATAHNEQHKELQK